MMYQPFDSALGPMILAATKQGLAGAWFVGQRHFAGVNPLWHQAESPVLEKTQQQLTAYFKGQIRPFSLALDPQGTDFQRRVWQALLAVPRGQTWSYSQLALALDQPNGARAVASAIGKNPISVVIPCHRVIGKHGALSGYAGGLARKSALLALESGDRQALDQFSL